MEYNISNEMIYQYHHSISVEQDKCTVTIKVIL